jgi:D-alanine-D-alanine ligase
VPKFAVLRRGSTIPSVGFPAICKPAAEDASIGVEQRSVVRTTRQLTERASAMLERWDEVIVQRYVEGREVNVGIVGDATLPIAEIDFGQMPKGMWRIVTYRSKWETGSDEDLGSAPQCPARLPASVATGLRKVAMAAWRMVGGAGYGRVDFRIDERGRPWILEVNANPDIAPDAGLARMAGVAGIEYGALVRQICELGLRRARGGSDTADQWALAQRLSGVTATDGTPDLFTSGEA